MFKKMKFNNKKVQYENTSFSSKLEASLYKHLKASEEMGLLSDLKTQDNVHLTKANILYIPDFSFIEEGRRVYAEAKGFETPTWRIKRRLWKWYGPGQLRIYKAASYGNIILAEVIESAQTKE